MSEPLQQPEQSIDLRAQLRQERYALSSLLEFVRILTPDLGAEGIVRSVVRTIMGKSVIMDSFAYLEVPSKDETQKHFRLVTRSGFRNEVLPQTLTFGELEQLLTADLPQFRLLPIVAPDESGTLAVLSFGKSINQTLRLETETTYLASLSALTAIALTNTKLFERERERERLESELRLAREIQESLFPHKFPQVDGLEVAAVTRSSEWVGGDYYDVIRLDDHQILFAVADVVGKGITAALTMSNLQAALRALVSLIRNRQLDLLAVVKELNRLMCESTAPERFITGIFGIFNTHTRTLESAVCGHPNPLIVRSDSCFEIPSTGIPLGIIPTYPFETTRQEIESGSVILSYTDGLSEAKYNGIMIGVRGIERVVEIVDLLEGSLDAGLSRIVDSTELKVEDDITILALRYNERT